MESNQSYLFKDKRFLPLFIVQFCGCFNDSILKHALIILVTYKLKKELNVDPYFLVMLANVLFILPFVIFASISGQIADKFERVTIVRIIKVIEIGIVMLASYGFWHVNLPVLFACIALMGVHSTFFGPLKYSIIPDQMKKDELLTANGYVEAGTFLSILIGTMLGGIYNDYNTLIMISAYIIAVVGFIASWFMPKSNNYNPDIKLNFNFYRETIDMVKYAASKKQIYMAILGISWFWFIGAAIMSQIPHYAHNTLGANQNVSNLFFATFSIGVGVGSFWCSKLFGNKITTKYVFLAALGISFVSIDLFFASRIASISHEPEQLKTIWQFLSKKHYWRILVDLFLLAAISGLYVVPLFALMQQFISPAHRSRVIAVNNFINSIFMVASTAVLSFLVYMEFSIPMVILFIGAVNLVVAMHIYELIPDSKVVPLKVWRVLFKGMFENFYTVEVKGLENYEKAGKRTVIVANHLSYLDPALIATYVPDEIKFAINLGVSREWWVRPFLKIVKTYPLDPNNPMAIKSLIEEVKKDKKIAIFPEGRTTVTGSLMKIYEGPGMIADKAGATILPIRVEGTQFTIFSKVRKLMKGKFRFRRIITITVLPPVKFDVPDDLGIRERRKFIGEALYDIMTEMLFESSKYKETLFQGLINATKIYGTKPVIMEDIDANRATYKDILLKSFVVSQLVSKSTKPGEIVGLMLPNMVGSMITFFGIQAAGRVPAMMNFTSGASNIISACETAQIKTLYTSHKFIEKAELQDLIKSVQEAGINVAFLEDLRKDINVVMKLKGLAGSLIPDTYYNKFCAPAKDTDTAVILFTSGTEGKPKAVALSHRNLQANAAQVLSRYNFNPNDLAFNALPIFHTFGLGVSLIMSLNGIKTFFYPSPLHYRIIPEVVYDIAPTVMFGTDTFLSGYAAYAHPYDFYSLRYIIAGAEKLKPRTRQTWFDKYGVRIFEGYGVTEASPVISANTPMHDRAGTVGRLMPKIEHFLEPVEGIQEGGRLYVKGPNIMKGYIHSKNPGVIEQPAHEKLGEGWYDTGDIVSVDTEGYVTILGREKRFAKVGGEMVSLSAVEELVMSASPNSISAAVCIEDDKKGEQILLFTNDSELARSNISAAAKEKKISELHIPKIVIHVKEVPVLATGKMNYRKMIELAKKHVAA